MHFLLALKSRIIFHLPQIIVKIQLNPKKAIFNELHHILIVRKSSLVNAI